METDVKHQEKIDYFLSRLKFFEDTGIILRLKRGINTVDAFERFQLDPKFNSLDLFSERLFFFGSKAKYFWKHPKTQRFSLKDTSKDIAEYIFLQNQVIAKTAYSSKPISQFKKKNSEVLDFFSSSSNLKFFIEAFDRLERKPKFQLRNYYLSIIHQIGNDAKYAEASMNVSATKKESCAKYFSHNGIVINFWTLNYPFCSQVAPSQFLPRYIGFPYPKQKEVTMFGAIFPNFIYSFTHEGKQYFNPAIHTVDDADCVILSGFDIEQNGFGERLLEETSFENGVVEDDGEFYEIF